MNPVNGSVSLFPIFNLFQFVKENISCAQGCANGESASTHNSVV